MGKIRKQFSPEKHGATLSPFISKFITDAQGVPLHKLRQHLVSFPRRWPFPRGDLYHWINVLNRFDDILQLLNESYGLTGGAQARPFDRSLVSGKVQSGGALVPELIVDDADLNACGYSEEGDRELAEDIVAFTRLLHENCGNRSLYASSGRLNDLLNTTSLSLLEKTLRLSHRLAQRYTASRLRNGGPALHLGHISQGLLASHYAINLQKLEVMTQPLYKMTNAGRASLLRILDGAEQPKHPSRDPISATDAMPSSFMSPSELASASEIEFLATDSTHDPLILNRVNAQAITHFATSNGIAESNDYNMLHRARLLCANFDSEVTRTSLVAVRLLAIANLAQIYPEATLQEKALKSYSDKPRHLQLPQTLCELLRSPSNSAAKIPRKISSLALLTLESLTNHKSLSNEVCTALNVTVNHGPLASALRQGVNLITDSDVDEYNEEEIEWLAELFALLHAIPKASGRAVDGLLSAGLIEMLLEILKAKTQRAEQRHAPALGFLSIFVYNTNDALGSLVNSGGLDVVSDLLVHEIDLALSLTKEGKGMLPEYRTQVTDYQIPFVQQQCLRAIFKFVYNMLSMSGGAFDRLMRNLIESGPVLSGLRTVISNNKQFGSNVWTNCVNVFSSFINNEPTSYNAIAEAGIPQAILESITQRPVSKAIEDSSSSAEVSQPMEDSEPSSEPAPQMTRRDHGLPPRYEPAAGGILPACEAVNAIPDAFGAMCLNESGMQQFDKSGALDTLFEIFVSPAHVKAFSVSTSNEIDRLGNSLEQLHRHNPSLAVKINTLVLRTATRVADIVLNAPLNGNIPDSVPKQVDGLSKVSLSDDVEMKDAQSSSDATKDSSASSTSTLASTYVGFFTKFLASLFRNASFCSRFTESGGLETLLSMACSPSLFRCAENTRIVGPMSCIKLADVCRHMAEQKPHIVLPPLIARIKTYLDKIESLLEHPNDSSFIIPLIYSSREGAGLGAFDRSQRENIIRHMVAITVLIECLSKSLVPAPPAHPARNAPTNHLAQIMVADMLSPVVSSLGRLQIKILWEHQLDVGKISSHLKYSPGASADVTEQLGDAAQSLSEPEIGSRTNGSLADPKNVIMHKSSDGDIVYIISNFQYLIPKTITELLAKISNTIVPRRLSDGSYQKQQIQKVADRLAQVVLNLLSFDFPAGTEPSVITTFRKASLDCIRGPLLGSASRDYVTRSGNQLQTLVIIALSKMGGVKVIGDRANAAMQDSIRSNSDVPREQQANTQRDEATAVLNQYISLLGEMTDKKALQESAHTVALAGSRERDHYRSDLFNSAQLLVELRLEVARSISAIWSSDDLHKLQGTTIKVLSKVIQNILEGQGEQGASSRGTRIPKNNHAEPKKWKVREDQLQPLLEAYPRDLCEEALYRCNSGLNNSREYCSYHHKWPLRGRFPPPAEDIQQPPAELDTEAPPSASTTGQPAVDRDSDASIWDQGTDDPDADPHDTDWTALRPTAFIDALSDVAQTILQDPSHAAYPTESITPAPQGPQSPETPPKVEEAPEGVTIDDLDEERAEFRANLMDRCLSLAGAYDDVTFEMSDLITSSTARAPDPTEMKREISATLVMSLVSYAGNDNLQTEGKKVSGIAHLLGIVLQDREFFTTTRDELKESFSSLAGLLPVPHGSKPAEIAPWIPQVLLILEHVLANDVQPHQIEWVPPSSSSASQEQPEVRLPEPMVTKEDRLDLFTKLLDLLPKVGKELELGVSIGRVLVILTRNRDLATLMAEKRNMQRFLLLVKQLAPTMSNRFRSSVLLILRHIVEDEDTIKCLMRSDIRELLDRPSRPIDTTRYTRDLYHTVLRSPELFVEVTNEMVELTKFDRNQNPQTLTLKKKPAEEIPTDDEMKDAVVDDIKPTSEKPDVEEKPKVNDIKPPVVEHPDGVIHFLLSELLTYKDVEDMKPIVEEKEKPQLPLPLTGDVEMADAGLNGAQSPQAVQPSTPVTQLSTEKEQFRAEEHMIYIYRCFILTCLTELLASYNKAKIEFINFSRKADPQAATPPKPRSGVLNYLLNALLPTGSIQHARTIDAKKKATTSNTAILTVVALCARTSENGSMKNRDSSPSEDEPELLFVRRFVLEHALKAYKDCLAASDSVEAKYSKLLALADLFNRMLAGRPSPSPGFRRSNPQDDNLVPTNKQIAKIMFEKNFIGALTSSMSEIDLKLLGANRVVKYVLRPLKLLTHTAIELSLSSDPSTSPGTTTDDDEISSATSVSDAENDREETPDLFRHSTLGMFEPGRADEPSSSSEDEEEDEMYADGYADDMEFDEEDQGADNGEVVSDEDEEMEGVGPMEGLSGEMGIDVEIDLEEDGSDEDDEEDGEEHEDGDEDEDMDEPSGDDEEEALSEDDEHDHEGEDDDVEIMDEITGDDGNDSLGEQDDGVGWEDEGRPRPQVMLDLLAREAPRYADDGDQSDAEAEQFSGAVMDAMDDAMGHEHIEIDIGDGEDGDDAIDMESGDDDEDEEEFEEELMYREEDEDEESEMQPYIFNPWPSTPGRRGTTRPGGLLPRPDDFALHADSMLYGADYRTHRSGGTRGNEGGDGQNPLLNRSRRTTVSGGTGIHRAPGGAGHIHRMPSITSLLPRLEDLGPGSDPEHYHYLTSLINALGRGGPNAILPALHGHHHHGPIQFRIGSAPGAGGGPREFMEIQIGGHPPNMDFPPLPPHHSHGSSSNDPAQAVNFQPAMTTERWQEEARLIFGTSFYDKAVKVINSILRLLVPPAMEAERIKKEKAEEEARKAQEEVKRVEKERATKDEQERKEREEREAREKVAAEEAAAAAIAAREQEGPEAVEDEAGENMEGVEHTAEEEPSAEASTPAASAPAERVHTTIRGQQLDITDLGIDNDYLEALPEEMREEVIMQVYAEHRSEAAAAGTEPNSYQREFLDALPPDIREEILQQERADRRRREREEQRRRAVTNSGQPAQAEEMDPASFMASLDPALRQQVLAEADDDMLANLPPDLAAEARALGGHHRRRVLDPGRLMADIDHLTALSGPSRERRQEMLDRMNGSRPQRRPIVQMLDKASVVTLLRLMFIPIQGNARQTLNGILRNASGNHQTRSEIVSGLLAVLQEGSVDQAAVERSFSQMTGRARQTGVNKTPVKKSPSSEAVLHTEANPRLVIGNCLSSLIFLTQSITHIPKFFLSEHEVVGGPKGKAKGKGKARDTKASRIPLNALLTLLDRDVVIENSNLIEQLAGLLQSVTQPLPALLKREKEDAKSEAAKATPAEAQEAETAVSVGIVPADGPVPATAEVEVEVEAADAQPNGESTTAGQAIVDEMEAKDALKPALVDAKKAFVPPDIPEENLRLIINILTARDCGGKTFRDALSTINNLSMIPNARDIFGQELVQRARQLGQSIASDLAQLMKDLRGAGDAMEAQNMALTKFSPTGSDQSKLNRILTALDYLFDAKFAENKESDPEATVGLLTGLHEDPSFSMVWSELSATLTAAYDTLAKGQQSDKTYLNVATILLPLIESLMVVCKRLDLKDSRAPNASQKVSQPTTPGLESTMKMIFFNFTNQHRKILNDLVRSNPKLMSGSFSVLVKNSSVLEFDNKRNYFNRRLHHRNMDMRQYPHPSLQLNVRRDLVFTDSYRSLYFKKPEEMKYGKLNIRFHNEEGVDAGGVTREWFQVLSRQMFDPSYALFNPVASDRTTFHPNPLSAINDAHLNYFNFIGRIIGKALYENRVLDCHFSRAVYKRILGKQVSLKDMETIDLDYTKSLQWMLENEITDIITETFSVTEDEFGVIKTIDLMENGSNIPVTDDNKHEYVRLVIEYKLTGSVNEQLESFLKGFHDIVPAELIAIFDEGELELLISGMPEIDIFDWKNNTDYHNYNANSAQIQWFWRAVRSYDKEERAKLLQFVTGTGKVPLNGFKELEGMNGFTRFSIHKDYGNKDRLPSSHTCFNQLDLPEYDSYESLRKNLYTAMTTGGEYFGFA